MQINNTRLLLFCRIFWQSCRGTSSRTKPWLISLKLWWQLSILSKALWVSVTIITSLKILHWFTLWLLIYHIFIFKYQQMQAKCMPMVWPKLKRSGRRIWKPSWRYSSITEPFVLQSCSLILHFSIMKIEWTFHRWVRCRSWGNRSLMNWTTLANLTRNISVQHWIIWTSLLEIFFLL